MRFDMDMVPRGWLLKIRHCHLVRISCYQHFGPLQSAKVQKWIIKFEFNGLFLLLVRFLKKSQNAKLLEVSDY